MKRDDSSRILMMIDINGFKEINDTYGHLAGDDILVESAGIIKKATRVSELVSRYGGDEFVIILHQNSDHATAAKAFIARIENLLAERNVTVEHAGPKISLSYGYTVLYKNSDISQALLEADKNMYLDKEERKKSR
jgi:diguanylate cyclase (GGDEF)-like protein